MLIGFTLVLSWTILGSHLVKPNIVNETRASWTAEFPNRGQSTTFVLSFLASHEGGEAIETVLSGNAGNTDIPVLCETISTGSNYSCKALFTPNGLQSSLKVESSGAQTSLTLPKVEIARKTRNAPFPVNKLFALFFLLLALAPLMWILHRFKVASQWVIVAIAVGILMWLQPFFSACLLGLISAYYYVGNLYRQSSAKSTFKILSWVVLTVIILMIFKNFKAIFFLPFENYGALALVLPLGTSYFLIRLIDLQLRWHRGQLEDLSFREYLTYVIFPPTIVAGPIELIDGFRSKRLEKITFEDISIGLMRISLGVAKKLIIVDFVLTTLLFGTGLWDRVVLNPMDAGFDVVLFCLLAYLFAYLDFSSYSDISIGMSRLYGYDILENFNWPVLASNISEFWKRWHISLSGWCFRNIFFPILMTSKSVTLALLSTLFAVGLWHDLSLSWMTWGLYHGFGLSVYSYLTNKKRKFKIRLPKGVGLFLTNIYVAFGFAFGSIADYSVAWQVFVSAWIELLIAPVTLLTSIG